MGVRRIAAAAVLAAVALTVAGAALATPKLVVQVHPAKLSFTVSQAGTDAQPGKIAVFAPAVYRLRSSQPAGTVIGSAVANFALRDAGNAPTLMSGDVVAQPATT